MLDVLIVGSGPAGLSAAIYTSRAGLSTLVLEGDLPGGLVTTTEQIDNYLGMPEAAGAEMAAMFRSHAASFGAELKRVEIQKIEVVGEGSDRHFVTTGVRGELISSRSVIFGAGSTPRKLGVKGEDLTGVSYCATCDGLFYSEEDVVVVGGGESAAEEALYLSKIARKVDVLVRGDKWRASEPAVAHLEAQSNVRIHMSTRVDEVVGGSEVEAVKLANGEEIAVTGVFVAIGQNPNSHTAGEHVTLFEDGFIQNSETPGFFVAGDISNPAYRQVIVAAGDGAKAGIDATSYIHNS